MKTPKERAEKCCARLLGSETLRDGESVIERAIAEAVAKEREACAKVCDEMAKDLDDEYRLNGSLIVVAEECASKIRSQP